MDENKIENLLKEIGKEELIPSEELVIAAKRKIRNRNLIGFAVGASLIMQILSVFIVFWYFFNPEISLTNKLVFHYIPVSGISLMTAIIILFKEKVLFIIKNLEIISNA